MRIFLTGSTGAGKTYLGKIWADDNGLAFYDLDALIEDEERMTIDKIFSVYGEGYFREKEAAILRNTDRFDHCMIACGGGTPCFFRNMEWMNRNGITVYLNETEENIFHHLVNDKTQRPLLKNKQTEELKFFIAGKLQERKKYYEQSKIILAAEDLNRSGFDPLIKKIKNA